MPLSTELCKLFGQRVRKYRKAANLSQEELAEAAQLHRTYIGMIERGEKNATLTTIQRLASALDVSVIDLLK